MKILTNEDKQYLLSVSAYVMPDNPTMQGWTAQNIKKHYYEPSLMLFSWLQATQQEVNVNTSLFQDELAKIKNGQTIVKKAEQDKNGNDIVATYETKVDAKTKYDKLDNKKLDKVNDYSVVYGTNQGGQQTTIYHTSGLANNSLVRTDDNGRFWVQEPIANGNPTTKKYVDGSIEESRKEITGLQDQKLIEQRNYFENKLVYKADLENGKIPASQLPSFVDDVLEFPTFSDFPTTGTQGIVYIDLSTNKTYRWGQTEYIVIATDLALGETSETAYAGDKGRQNAENILRLGIEKQDKLIAGKGISIVGNTITTASVYVSSDVDGDITLNGPIQMKDDGQGNIELF